MKINKELLEEVQLLEAEKINEEEEKATGDGIENVENASHAEVKAEVEASMEKTGTPVTPEQAEALAKQIEADVNALSTRATEYAAVNAGDPDSVINKLNACLETGLERWSIAKTQGSDAARGITTSNLLIYGMPGFGKTAAIKAWCKSLGIYMLSTTMSTLQKEVIAGIPWPEQDPETKRYIQRSVGSELWEPLYKYDKVVVFLDELNTSKKDVESALLAFISEHVLPTVSRDAKGEIVTQTTFDNILFFVGAQNPYDPRLFQNHQNSDAIDSRFNLRHEQVGSRKEYLNVLKHIYENGILKNPYLSPMKRYKYEGQYRIGQKLMSDNNFYWDDKKTKNQYYNDMIAAGNDMMPHSMNYRELSQALFTCNGTKSDFLAKARWAQFSKSVQSALEVALARYQDAAKPSNTVFNQTKVDPRVQNAAATEIDSILQGVINDFSI